MIVEIEFQQLSIYIYLFAANNYNFINKKINICVVVLCLELVFHQNIKQLTDPFLCMTYAILNMYICLSML